MSNITPNFLEQYHGDIIFYNTNNYEWKRHIVDELNKLKEPDIKNQQINEFEKLIKLEKNEANSSDYHNQRYDLRKVSTLNEIKDHDEINFLYVSVDKLENIDLLIEFTNLEALIIRVRGSLQNDDENEEYLDISFINSWSKLKYLDLDNLQCVKNYKFISGLSKLEQLYLRNNGAFEEIKINFSNLKTLSLSDNNLKDEDLNTLIDENNRLSTLELRNNNLTNIKQIARKCKNLTKLNIENNNISTIAGIQHLSNLRTLDLSDNRISIGFERLILYPKHSEFQIGCHNVHIHRSILFFAQNIPFEQLG